MKPHQSYLFTLCLALVLSFVIVAIAAVHVQPADPPKSDTEVLNLFLEEKTIDMEMQSLQKRFNELSKRKQDLEVKIKAYMEKKVKETK